MTSHADVATRPGPHGQRVVSTGLDDLDRILGGGLPLGSICVIGEDGWTSHHSTLLRYFVSEGAYSGQVWLCIDFIMVVYVQLIMYRNHVMYCLVFLLP